VALTRRQLLVGAGAGTVLAVGGGYLLVEQNVLPGKYKLDRLLGSCDVGGHVPDASPGPVTSGSFRSVARRGIDVGWSIAYPPGSTPGDALPFCLALHGGGGDHTWPIEQLGLAHFVGDAVTHRGIPPFAIATVDGGNTNWHPRANGDDSNAMIRAELLPLLASKGLRTDRFALWGWSLGGFGVLLLAEQLGLTRITSICATSAAVQPSFAAAPAGSFDSQADYETHDVYAMRTRLDGIPLRMDVGDDDPLHGPVVRFRDGLRVAPDGGVSAGCHDEAFWRKHAPDELAFLARFL